MKFGIFIYPDVEPIDLATFGVLSMARRIHPEIELCTIAPRAGEVKLVSGFRVIADYDLASAPRLDVLVVTGGPGWQAESSRPETLSFLRQRAAESLVVSVCTGGMILAASGLLDGKAATTKSEVVPPETSPLAMLKAQYPTIDVRNASLVDENTIVTGGGVALCIDAMLHVIARLFGDESAAETARIIEYGRAWRVNREQLPPYLASNCQDTAPAAARPAARPEKMQPPRNVPSSER
jgi:transcriptional regulator GlxA family with amidase domain